MNNLQQQAREAFPRWIGNTDRVDHLAWARRIVWRAKQGDKEVSLVQLQMAQQSLGEL